MITDMAILLIEHDMSVVMGISDHVVVLDYGKKISDGTPNTVKNDPAVIRAYLGVEDVEEELKAIAKAEAKPAAKPAVAVASAARAPLPKLAAEFKSDRVNVPPPPVLKLPDEPAPVHCSRCCCGKGCCGEGSYGKGSCGEEGCGQEGCGQDSQDHEACGQEACQDNRQGQQDQEEEGRPGMSEALLTGKGR